MSSRAPDAALDPEAAPTTVESLLHEIDSVGGPSTDQHSETDDSDDSDDDRDAVAAAAAVALESLGVDEEFAFDESMVKANLEPILLTLVALQERGTHGKGLMDDLARLFDAQLSPGTVYPSLHDLDEEDVLYVLEMVRTKEYRVDDDDAARARIGEAMRQHLALGVFFERTLRRMA
jgi:hypothetical protein